MTTQSNTERAPSIWWPFILKMALGLLWAGALIAGGLALKSTDLAPRILGGLLVGIPAFVWLLSISRRASIDELESRLAVSALAQGGWWAVSFGATFYGFMAAMGDPPAGIMLTFLPLGAFFFGEVMAQMTRAGMARSALP